MAKHNNPLESNQNTSRNSNDEADDNRLDSSLLSTATIYDLDGQSQVEAALANSAAAESDAIEPGEVLSGLSGDEASMEVLLGSLGNGNDAVSVGSAEMLINNKGVRPTVPAALNDQAELDLLIVSSWSVYL